MRSLDTGETPVITARVPKELRQDMDRVRAHHGLTRSAFLRRAIDLLIEELELSEAGAE